MKKFGILLKHVPFAKKMKNHVLSFLLISGLCVMRVWMGVGGGVGLVFTIY